MGNTRKESARRAFAITDHRPERTTSGQDTPSASVTPSVPPTTPVGATSGGSSPLFPSVQPAGAAATGGDVPGPQLLLDDTTTPSVGIGSQGVNQDDSQNRSFAGAFTTNETRAARERARTGTESPDLHPLEHLAAPARALDRDPWPAFLDASIPPDAPTLVEAAPPTRASVMSVYVGPHMIAALSYLVWWLSGLTVYYNERRNRFVRFHAVQSILLTGTLTIFDVLAYVASNLLFEIGLQTRQPIFGTLGQGLGLLAFFLTLMFWLAPMIAAWSGAYLRIPVIGDYAERFAAIPIEVDATAR